MKTRKILAILVLRSELLRRVALVLAVGLVVWAAEVSEAGPMGTAFTYQGHLYDANHVANGLYDFQFKLYDANVGAGKVGNDVNVPNVDVIDGYFTVELDFGEGVFNGEERWLEIGVRPGDSAGSFTTLSPRQEITAAPYALHASSGNIKQLVQDFVVASGESVTAGDVVSFLEGEVQKGFVESNDIGYGLEYEFNPASTRDTSAAALSATKFVVVYKDWDNFYLSTAVIGDISGDSISFGQEYVINSNGDSFATKAPAVAGLTPTKFVAAYEDVGNSYRGTARIGDVSGNTIVWGEEYIFNPGTTYNDHLSVAALSSTKLVIAYQDGGNSYYGTAIIGDVSDSNIITFGPEYVFNSAGSYCNCVVELSSSRFVVAYQDGTIGTAIIGDVSDGNNLSYSSEYVFNAGTTDYSSASALSSTKFVVVYKDTGNSDYGTAVIGDVSGDSISYGSEYVFNPAMPFYISVDSLSSTRFVVVYQDTGNSDYGTAIIGDVSDGNTISWGPECVFNPGLTPYTSVAGVCSTQFVVSYTDFDNSFHGTARVGDVPRLGNLVGIAKESATGGQTVPVIINGVSDIHSGLVSGEVYYSDTSGGLTTDVTDFKIGLAISTTELLLRMQQVTPPPPPPPPPII